MDTKLIGAYIFFFIALFSGFMAIIARNIWRDPKKTQLFAYVGIVATLVFMALVFPYLPD